MSRKKPAWHPYILILAGILFLAVLFTAYTLFFSNSHSGSRQQRKHPGKICCGPSLQKPSDSLAKPVFYDGLMEDVIGNLSKMHNLRVISRTSTEQFRKAPDPVSEMPKN